MSGEISTSCKPTHRSSTTRQVSLFWTTRHPVEFRYGGSRSANRTTRGAPAETLDPVALRALYPDAVRFDANQPLDFDSGGTPLDLERFILFGSYATYADLLPVSSPTTDMQQHEIFFAPTDANTNFTVNTDKTLEPGQYLTLMPRVETHIGSQKFVATPIGSALQGFFCDTFDGVSTHTFGLIQRNSVGNDLLDGVLTDFDTVTNVRDGLPLVVNTFAPTTWTSGTGGVPTGISIAHREWSSRLECLRANAKQFGRAGILPRTARQLYG